MTNGSGMPVNPWDQFMSHVYNLFENLFENLGNILWFLLSIVAIFLCARLLLNLISRLTRRVMNSKRYHQSERQGKRIDTLMTLARSFSRYCVYFLAVLMVFNKLGVVKNLLAVAGIGSFAIGFGAQSLVKDVINGFFMMFENQFSVGDYVKIDDNDGIVEATAMRVTYLRSFKGDQIIIPNGTISRVINYTRGGYLASVTVSTPYEADTRAVIALLGDTVAAFAKARPELLEDAPYVQGVTSFNTYSVDITVVAKSKMMKQWEVERGLRLAIKEAFDLHGLSIPYPHYVQAPQPTVPHLQQGQPKEDGTQTQAESQEEMPLWKNAELDDD